MSLQRLQEIVLRFRNERNWSQFHTPKDVVISLGLEAAELAEVLQWRKEEHLRDLPAEQRLALAEELSDVLYWVLLIAADAEIDLETAFQAKMKKNAEKYPVEDFKDRAR